MKRNSKVKKELHLCFNCKNYTIFHSYYDIHSKKIIDLRECKFNDRILKEPEDGKDCKKWESINENKQNKRSNKK